MRHALRDLIDRYSGRDDAAAREARLARFIPGKQYQHGSVRRGPCRRRAGRLHRSGKGRHPAGLDFGDCCSYATAVLAREALLCIGGDFPQADLELVPLDD